MFHRKNRHGVCHRQLLNRGQEHVVKSNAAQFVGYLSTRKCNSLNEESVPTFYLVLLRPGVAVLSPARRRIT